MEVSCIHCGRLINTRCRISETCYCGRPIREKVIVLGKILKSQMSKFKLGYSDSFGYQGMSHYERMIQDIHSDMGKLFIDQKGYLYILK